MSAPTTIEHVEIADLNLDLHAPFGIATGAQQAALNLLCTVRLAGGAVGLGEAAPFPAVNGETQDLARQALGEVAPLLIGQDARRLRPLSELLRRRIGPVASARCAVETAVLDALCRHHQLPLSTYFGGSATTLRTDLTITTGTVAAARTAAADLAAAGFTTIKLKVGGVPHDEDVARIAAVLAAAPGRDLLLDGNCGISDPQAALFLVRAAQDLGGTVVLFEQPLPKDDLAGMAALCQLLAPLSVPVCADEAVTHGADVLRIAAAGAAQVVNIKIMKSGVCDSVDLIAAARAAGLLLMVGGMVESSLAMTVSACLAAGQGGFSFIDLDTPLFLRGEPFVGQAVQRGPDIDLSAISAGHGVRLR